jgi:prepilin-type processing-associated H-X9-DG protein
VSLVRRILVPLVVVALGAALFLWRPSANGAVELDPETSACAGRLREIYAGLRTYATLQGHAPSESGGAFLEALITSGTWPDEPESRARLLCPGTNTPYSARDVQAHPLARFPSGGDALEALAACDGAARLPHRDGVNVLFSDGSVRTFSLEQERAAGRVPTDARNLPVGPDSPLPELRVLAAD